MLTDRPPSHAPLGLLAGASFVLLALAAFASVYLLVLGARSADGSNRQLAPELEVPAETGGK